MAYHIALLLFDLFLICGSASAQRLPESQTQALQQIRKQLEYPKQLDAWNTKNLCAVLPSNSLAVSCEGSTVTGLKIIGDRLPSSTKFDGYPLPNFTLSQDFSMDSLITTLSRLTSLKVVILVSLGIWGPLPGKIHRLYALEVLNLSSNYIYGSIPPKISEMGMLQTLVLDGNFFNESVPDWFPSLQNLTVLSLKNNRLQGSLPKEIGAIRTLSSLALSSNEISGNLPDLSGLSSLEMLDLRKNHMDSNLPAFPVGLITILLNGNSFSGEIPLQLGKLNQLQHLDLSYNLLEGSLPSQLFSLSNLSYLNLANNMLSGSLPEHLSCSTQLGFVDISDNRLTGHLPSCLDPALNKRVVKFQGNCFSIDGMQQHAVAYCSEAEHKQADASKGRHKWLLVGGIVGALVAVLVIFLLLLFHVRRSCHEEEDNPSQKPVPENSRALSTEFLANARFISQKQKLGMQLLPSYRQFSLEELQEATKNFSQSSYIGDGSTAKVYKGILENGTSVAIKCLSISKGDSVRNLKLRLDLLSKLRHPHLVCLLGHCIDSPVNNYSVNRIFLVYEYLPNGNLRDLLLGKTVEKTLKWPDRLAILIGIAKALNFLHIGMIPGFFSNRLRTTNILIDEHHMAKISNFGLSIITEEIDKHEVKVEGEESSHLENLRKAEYAEDDIYAFGYILLEVLVGPSMIEKGEALFFPSMATASTDQEERKRILHPVVLNSSTEASLSTVISLANKCISPDPSIRPSIEDILWNLQYAEQVHTSAQNDQKSDATSQF